MALRLLATLVLLAAATVWFSACTGEDGNRLFEDAAAPLADVDSRSLAWADYDNDGDLDLAVAGSVLNIYRNDSGEFVVVDVGLPQSGSVLAWGDYDNDGDLDLALARMDGSSRICSIYRNDDGSFVDIAAGLYGAIGDIEWADYDNDGDLDLAITGFMGNDGVSKIYRNDGSDEFVDIRATIAYVYGGSLAWGDYDNDGDLDLALTGYGAWPEGVGEVYRIDGEVYRNDGSDTFTGIDAGIPGAYLGALAWGDYDNDGDLDLAVAGESDSMDTGIYRNDGADTFTRISAGLPYSRRCSLAWGDYDSDGDLDLVMIGDNANRIFRNDSGGAFTGIDAGLAGYHIGSSVAWGDYDNDGDLDLATAGLTLTSPLCRIYRNTGSVINTAPAAPTGISVSSTGTGPYQVTFSWEDGSDVETPASGLTYNMRVGTSSGGNEVCSGHAAVDGWRRLPALGVIRPGASGNTWRLELPSGTYYWSVQAIDTALTGGEWAPEDSLALPQP